MERFAYFSFFFLISLATSDSRRYDSGPSVDPGVFVITHVQSCRNNAGYCILGYSCDVDKDFLPDDLGGHCDGLGAAFNPTTNFVCCRENPDTVHENQDQEVSAPELPVGEDENEEFVEADKMSDDLVTKHETVTDVPASTYTQTEIVTEVVTETEKYMQVYNRVELVTEVIAETSVGPLEEDSSLMNTDIGLKIETDSSKFVNGFKSRDPETNCFAALLLGLNCSSLDGDKPFINSSATIDDPNQLEPTRQSPSLNSSQSAPSKTSIQIKQGDVFLNGLPVVDEDFLPTKMKQSPIKRGEDSLQGPTDQENTTEELNEPTDISQTTESVTESFMTKSPQNVKQKKENLPKSDLVNLDLSNFDTPNGNLESRAENVEENQDFSQENCGRLGGSAVLQAFGRAAYNLLPDLVANWVTGHSGHGIFSQSKSARLHDADLEPRIISGDVTSTVLYCWMAAIVENSPGPRKTFLCTGTLVKRDLVITSASCTHKLFQKGINNFKVILGDSNLNIDLPFGVQTHEISEVIIHENYKTDSEIHYDDIGLIRLKLFAKLENTICLLCLPLFQTNFEAENCTVVGYGRSSDNVDNQLASDEDETTDGILRKADLPIVNQQTCDTYLKNVGSFPGTESSIQNFLCAGGSGEEETCYDAMDGGSPLSCQKDGQHVLAGIVTFGTSCPHHRSPSLFTDVSKYSSWIRTNYLSRSKK